MFSMVSGLKEKDWTDIFDGGDDDYLEEERGFDVSLKI